ncbi:hypothetical protein KHQ81_07645 [Mycoplasmatota bacterium]|nr:hypothetical protein KHQ81_07645 [Mycoplasmatota bacterium]
MNNNEQKLDITYIIKKIDEITEQGKDLYKFVANMSDDKLQSIVAREETNRKLIDLLRDMLDRINPKVDTFTINSNVITGLTESLNISIENGMIDAQQSIIRALVEIQKSATSTSGLVEEVIKAKKLFNEEIIKKDE